MEGIMQGLLGIILALFAVQDFTKKKIHLGFIILAAVLLAVCIPFCSTITMVDRITGVLVGMMVILISKMTRGKIGMGDGLLLCITGLGLGLWSNIWMFAIALFFAAVVSVILLITHIANRKNSIPFIPFLFVSYLFIILN